MRLNSFLQCEIKVELSVQHPLPLDAFGNVRPEIVSVWVPINEFRFFGEGNIFKSQRQYGRSKVGELLNFAELPNHSIADISFKPGALVQVNKVLNLVRSRRVSHFEGAPYIVSSTIVGRPVFINPLETLRFFFSSFGGITSYLYEFAKTKSASANLIDRGKTGYISDGVYRIVPNSVVSDISSAFQLALIDTSTYLQDIWSNFISTLNRLSDNKSLMSPEILFPKDSVGIDAVAIQSNAIIGRNPPDQCWVITKLLSDRRKIPFKTLIIEQPNIKYQTASEATAVGAGNIRHVSDINKLILRKSAGSSKSRKHGFSGLPGLTEAFPNIDEVKIKIERPGDPEVRTIVPTEVRRRTMEEFSSSSSDSFMKTPGIIFRTPLHRRELFGGVTFEKGEPKSLFATPLEQYVKIVTISNQLNEKFQCLEEAGLILANDKKFVFDRVRLNRLQILELPRAWGPWAKGINNLRGRYVAVIYYHNEGRLNYAFEIESNEGKESYAIGIINKINNDAFDLHDFTCLMDHCRRRIYLRGRKRKPSDAYCGIWPTASEYQDIVGAKLIHSPKRGHPHYLAKDLLSKGIKS